MELSTLLLALIKTHDSCRRVGEIITYLRKRYEQIKVTYFSYNIVNRELVEIPSGGCFKQSDYTNPVVLSFLENKKILSNKIVSYTDTSSFKQYFRAWGTTGYCLIIPAQNIGVWVFYCEKNKLLEDESFLCVLLLIINGFVEVELLDHKNKQLEEQNIYLSQELNKGEIHFYEELQRDYIERHWIDERPSGKKLKRRLLSLAKNDRTLALIGESGYGRSHLTTIIHQLRNANLVALKEINLLNVNNIVELDNLLENHFFNIREYAKETVIIKNIEFLNDYLLDKLINFLSYKRKSVLQLKLILIVSDSFFLQKRNQIDFLLEESIQLENRMSVRENRALFLEEFCSRYIQKTGSRNKVLSDNIKNRIINEKSIREITQLKFLVDFIYNHDDISLLTEVARLEEVFLQDDWYQPMNLTWHVDLYEKALIYQSLTQSNWSQKDASEKLMIPRRTLNYKCRKYGLGKKNVL